jgi:hypothetical protein
MMRTTWHLTAGNCAVETLPVPLEFKERAPEYDRLLRKMRSGKQNRDPKQQLSQRPKLRAERQEVSMKSNSEIIRCALITAAVVAALGSTDSARAAVAEGARAEGTPGSPSATMTISGKQLPAPDPKFGGVIKETAKESTAWWPPRIVPPKGVPNVVLSKARCAGS